MFMEINGSSEFIRRVRLRYPRKTKKTHKPRGSDHQYGL